MMTIDLIALDLDGTLLDSNERISAGNRAAIGRALAEGIRVVLVTGRGVDAPVRISDELGLNLPVICCHGALTKDFRANRTLVHIPVPLQSAKAMVEFAEANELALAVYSEEFFWRISGTRIFMDDMTGPAWRETHSLAETLGSAPTFLRFMGTESVAAMERKFGDLPLRFIHERWRDFVECVVLNPNAGKQQALARLCADFQISRDRVLAVGDSHNDVPMLRWAGIGVAMGNADPEVKEACRYVTAPNDKDGVALAIEKFCLAAPNGRAGTLPVTGRPAPKAKR
ncbi:MAG TPA: Cof-type HAD-IIB family hydrolase [Candidatus Acidoferrales bacterium]|nr:Cof-type HAD-IIB family hydrolase [Candidatus Acidoferrales bacterium]